MSYDNGYLTAIKKFDPNSTEDDPHNSVEHHTYTKENSKTTIVSQYPSNDNPLYSTTTVFDKYGRVESIGNTLSNVYDLWPKFDESGELWGCADNGSSLLAISTDLLRNEKSRYKYNDKNALTHKTVTDKDNFSDKISEETFTYDNIGRLTRECYYPNPEEAICTVKAITYEKDDTNPLADGTVSEFAYTTKAIAGIILPNHVSYKTVNEYDTPFHRLTKKTLNIYNINPNSTLTFDKCFTYDKTRISDVEEHFLNHEIGASSYEYDNMGRISSMSVNGNTTSYTYDEYGQLTKEETIDKTIEYVYNNSTGNLTGVTTNGTTVQLGYTDTTHPDRLTSYNGKAITYNSNGGVASYDGWNYNWNNQGKLSSITTTSNARAVTIKPSLPSSSKTYSFTYNALGQRIASNYSYFRSNDELISIPIGEVTSYSKTFYYDNAGRLLTESINETAYGIGNTSRAINFIYDESSMIGFEYSNGTDESVYYYQRNLLGDVIAIYDTTGTKVVEYSYDAWGNCTIKDTTTNYILAHANPIRYRGYYYDEGTKLYYLNSRYYSPEFRRFISPDDTSYLDYESVNGLNLYCYCNNDPVNKIDPSGYAWNWNTFWRGLGMVFTAVGAIALSVTTFGLATPLAMTAVASVTLGAGILTGINGVATIIESGTDYNFVRDGVFNEVLGLSDTAYDWYAGITAGVAIVGTSICTIWNITNPIKGFTYHGRQSALSHDGHGVNARAMQNAVRNPLEVVNQSNGGIKYIGKNAIVVLNKAGKVITTYAKSHYAWRRF